MAKSGDATIGPGRNLTAATANRPPVRWRDKVEKLMIGSLDDTTLTLTVVAQYNPKELQTDKQVQWQKPNRLPGSRDPDGKQDEVEVTSTPTRSISVELLFDGYEEHRSVQPEIDKLETLSSIQVPGSPYAPERRPHHCVVTWGETGMRPFRCVIETLAIKVTMFAPSGEPLRAICTLKLNEVIHLRKMLGPGIVG